MYIYEYLYTLAYTWGVPLCLLLPPQHPAAFVPDLLPAQHCCSEPQREPAGSRWVQTESERGRTMSQYCSV